MLQQHVTDSEVTVTSRDNEMKQLYLVVTRLFSSSAMRQRVLGQLGGTSTGIPARRNQRNKSYTGVTLGRPPQGPTATVNVTVNRTV